MMILYIISFGLYNHECPSYDVSIMIISTWIVGLLLYIARSVRLCVWFIINIDHRYMCHLERVVLTVRMILCCLFSKSSFSSSFCGFHFDYFVAQRHDRDHSKQLQLYCWPSILNKSSYLSYTNYPILIYLPHIHPIQTSYRLPYAVSTIHRMDSD